MPRVFLRSCAAGDPVDDVFVITGKQIATTTTGKFYIKCFVGDKSCQCTARMWNATREIFNQFPDSGFMYIRGRIENYQNNNQVIIEAWGPAREGQYNVADLLPHTSKDINSLYGRVVEMCQSVQNRHLAALLQTFLDDQQLMTNFRRSPAAMSFHHAYIGGLIEHTANAMEVACAVAPFYPGLNRDLVVAGIFLHDLAKTWELTYDACFGYSDGGQLVGHIVKVAMWIEDKAKLAAEELGEAIPRPLIDVLQHIMLSHHGEPEFGAAKVPATPEAIAVHMIENMDAKLMMSLGVTRGPESGESNWTEYQKAFGVRLYRPDVAPADADVEEPPAPRTAAAAAPATAPANGNAAGPALSNPLFGDFTNKKR